jgi:hypothetical protein
VALRGHGAIVSDGVETAIRQHPYGGCGKLRKPGDKLSHSWRKNGDCL